YQVRSACQFLMVLLPVLGVVLLGLGASRADWLRLRLRVGLGLLAAGLGPYLAWCTFRLFVVGHWGVACFTGYQFGAVAGHFLSDDILPDIPEELRPYVQAQLVQRPETAQGAVDTGHGHLRTSFEQNRRVPP